VLLKMLAFVSQMIHVRFPHLRLIENSLVLLHGMSIKQRGNCSVRVFQSLLDQLKAVFHDDVPNELQLREAAKQLCLPVHDNPGRDANGTNGYKLTSLAVWRLAKDANQVEASTPNQLVTRDQYAVEEITHSHFHHFINNGVDCSDLFMDPRAPRRDKKVVVDSSSVFPRFHGGGFQPGHRTTASLQRADADLLSEDRLLQENQKPRHNVRTQVRRLGRRLSQAFSFK